MRRSDATAGLTLHRVSPPRPPLWQERLGTFLLFSLGPTLERQEQPEPPPELAPWEVVEIPRSVGAGTLSGLWFPAPAVSRGGVLLGHPWVVWGKSYFYRRGRIEALRAAGYHVLLFDLPGLGESGPRWGFPDRDVADALAFLRARSAGLPLHVWGVSSGGHWTHPVISNGGGVAGAFFEDVSPHLLEWSWRQAPWGRPFYLFFRVVLRQAYRFVDMRRHAAARGAAAAGYVGGELDRGVLPADTRALAEASGGACLIVPDADHLASIKLANEEVIRLGLEVLARAELASGRLDRLHLA